MKLSIELRQQRKSLLDRAEQLTASLERERRDFTQTEKVEFDSNLNRVQILQAGITAAEADERSQIDTFEGRTSPSGSGNGGSGTQVSRASQVAGVEYATLPDGKTIRLLTPCESLRSVTPNTLPDGARPEEFNFGRAIRGIVTGSWKGADLEHRAISSGSGTGGGYLLEPILSAEVIDLARNNSVIFQAGARTVPMETAELVIARIVSDPTPTWHGESVALSEADMTFGQFKLGAKTLACLVAAPVELVEDAANLDALVRNSLAQALALELDKSILYGEGGLKINGLRNWQTGTPAIQTIDMGAAAGATITNYSKWSEAVEKVLTANGVPNATLYAPRTWGTLDRYVESTTGQPLNPPASYVGLQKLVSNQIPINLTHGTANNASDAWVGDFTKLLVGMRTAVTLEVSREAGDSFKKLQVYIRCYLRSDALPTQPAHFVLVKGIIPSV